MFIATEELEAIWEKALALYAEGKLTGIQHMKRGTDLTPGKSGVLIFFCSGDENEVKSYAENLLRYIPYNPPNGFMYYKSNEQTRELIYRNDPQGRKPWLYRLRCPPPPVE